MNHLSLVSVKEPRGEERGSPFVTVGMLSIWAARWSPSKGIFQFFFEKYDFLGVCLELHDAYFVPCAKECYIFFLPVCFTAELISITLYWRGGGKAGHQVQTPTPEGFQKQSLPKVSHFCLSHSGKVCLLEGMSSLITIEPTLISDQWAGHHVLMFHSNHDRRGFSQDQFTLLFILR